MEQIMTKEQLIAKYEKYSSDCIVILEKFQLKDCELSRRKYSENKIYYEILKDLKELK